MNRYQKFTSNIFISAAVIALLQFTHALEYMMVSPIFTFIADDLLLPVSFSGYVTGAYTASSVLSGVISFFFIDRLNQKRTLIINVALLGVITAITPFSYGLVSLLVMRVFAGLLGGVTLGVGLALLINRAPVELRGRVIAIVVSAFSAVSILGLPLSIYLATNISWHYSFWLIAAICIACTPLVYYLLPDEQSVVITNKSLKMSPAVIVASLANAVSNFSPFVIIPLLAPMLISVAGIPTEQIPQAFFIGGIGAYAGTRLAGQLTDRWGSFHTGWSSSLLFCFTLLLLLLDMINGYLFIMLFMFSTYMRIVAASVLSSYFPDNQHRAGFNLLQTAFTNLSATVAFFISSYWVGYNQINTVSIAGVLILALISAAVLPAYFWLMARLLKQRNQR